MTTWNQHIQELTDEAREIITNINQAARDMEITWGQRDELMKIVLSDVADQANLQTARELLYAWN